jgi:large subunit ribosomal protein L21
MEAIIRHGGRQFRVKPGATIEIDWNDLETGSTVEFPEVLYVGEEGSAPRLGGPTVDGAKVLGKVVGKASGPKLIAASFRRRKNSRRRIGHRQKYLRVEIESIQG